ncbi:MAG: anti-sigma factor family protein [Limisphaerales bacterium]
MNHPNREAWVPYLYGETNAERRRELATHLQECPDCRRLIESWQHSLARLDAWKLPHLRRHSTPWLAVVRWAAATAGVLALGFILGRQTNALQTETLRARLEPQLREQVREELAPWMRSEMNRSAEATLAIASAQTEKLLAAYNTLNDARRAEDLQRWYVAVKQQLDTVALNTENGFVQLAANQPPAKPLVQQQP